MRMRVWPREGGHSWSPVRPSRASTLREGELIELDEYLRRVPKVELHCHFEGTVRAATFADLAGKHGVELPTSDVDKLYDYDSIYEFLVIFAMVSSTLIDREDFARAAYESIEDGFKLGNLRYREMFFNPTLHTKRGVPYSTVVAGLVDGIRAAETDFGVPCRLIADVYRQDTAEEAREMVEQVLAHPYDELIGLGMDGAEAPDPPEKFVESYRLAKSGGLRLTAHACEDAPAKNIETCLDLLGCERIDHGYHILGDDALVDRCREEGITFTVCPTATAVCYFDPEDYTTHPIREMVDRGLKCMVNSDDPSMFHTDIGTEYVKMSRAAGWDVAKVKKLVLNGIDGAWLSEDEKRRMRQEFTVELDQLEQAGVEDGAGG
jgi:adenosine deaminase